MLATATTVGRKTPRFKFRLSAFYENQELGFQVIFSDHVAQTFYLFLGIPWLFGMKFILNFTPGRLLRWLAGGEGETAHYGYRVCEYEIKFQWRKIIDIPGPKGGWEWRRRWSELAGEPKRESRFMGEEMWGCTLPATDQSPFQHFTVLISTIKTTTKYPVWWIPTIHHCYYTARAEHDVIDAQGHPARAKWKHYHRYWKMTEIVRDYQESMAQDLGFYEKA